MSVLFDALVKLPPQPPVFPWQGHGLDTFNGSAAIASMVSDIGLNERDAVLLPAYCCGAELGPFRHVGCEILFYDVNPDLSINREQIERCVFTYQNLRMLLITHYFGVPQPDVAELASWCRDKEIILAEDCAHALYSQMGDKPLGMYGDYAVFSPRKSLPVTEGGRLVSLRPLKTSTRDSTNKPVPRIPRWDRLWYSLQQGARSQPHQFTLGRSGSIILITMIAIPSMLVKLVKKTGIFNQQDWLTPDVEGEAAVPVYQMGASALTKKIFTTSDAQNVVRIRRSNFACWLSQIKESNQLRALIKVLPENSCPLYFPAVVSDPAKCVAALARADIEAFNWWQHMPKELLVLDDNACPVARQLKQSVIALPVHQSVTHQQIKTMADVLTRVAAQSASQ